jgi:hypothetical protein
VTRKKIKLETHLVKQLKLLKRKKIVKTFGLWTISKIILKAVTEKNIKNRPKISTLI